MMGDIRVLKEKELKTVTEDEEYCASKYLFAEMRTYDRDHGSRITWRGRQDNRN